MDVLNAANVGGRRTRARTVAAIALLGLAAAACGGGTGEGAVPDLAEESSVTSEAASQAAEPSTSTSEVSGTTAATAPAAPTSPAVAALISGRGDDGSLEVGMWFSSSPFDAGDVRLVVGTDSDDSYPGVGDPVPHIDAWAEVDGGDLALLDAGAPVADGSSGDLDQWLTWTGPGRTGWMFFMGNVPVRAGTVWIVLEIDGETRPGTVAGAPLGVGCSYHSAGIEIGAVPGDVPTFDTGCRYP